MRKKLSLLALSLCLAVSLSGCSALSFGNVTELLRAPALGEVLGDMEKALTGYLGTEPVYKYPQEGDLHSPILMLDLNGNGSEEGIVFFTTTDPERSSNVYIAVLEQQDGDWVVTQDVQGEMGEVASMAVADILGDGTQQLVVGYARTKSLLIYSYTDGKINQLQIGQYQSYLLDDFSDRGATDLAVVTSGDDGLQINFITEVDGTIGFMLESAITLVDKLTSCVGMYISKNADGQQYLVVDGTTEGANLLATQVFVASESGERFYPHETEAADQIREIESTARSLLWLTSRDLDGDGMIETPRLLEEPADNKTIAEDLPLQYIEWVDFTADEPATRYFGLLDTEKGLFFQLPESWRGSMYVQSAKDGGWSIRRQGRILLSFAYYDDADGIPAHARGISGVPGAYLVPYERLGEYLNAGEIASIDVFLLD